MQTALSINASECSGGAGLLADLKTFTVLGVDGMGVVTGVTGPSDHSPVSSELIAQQLETIGKDLKVSAFKTGELSSAEMVNVVAEAIRRYGWDNFVCDPHFPESGEG